jgi:hypothetical protein
VFPPPPIEHADYLLAVLDLIFGSGGLRIACTEARYSFIAVELDEKQAEASAAVMKKFFQEWRYFSLFGGRQKF